MQSSINMASIGLPKSQFLNGSPFVLQIESNGSLMSKRCHGTMSTALTTFSPVLERTFKLSSQVQSVKRVGIRSPISVGLLLKTSGLTR